MKTLKVDKLENDFFYELKELKGKMKCDTWKQLLKKLVELAENQ